MHDITIKTERLLLRPLSVDDAEAVFEWVSDERVTRYMCYNTYQNIDEVRQWIYSLENDTEYIFGFERLSDGKLIGSGGIGPDHRGEGFWGFGYNLRYDCWGYGYATEAVRAMIDHAHREFGVNKVVCSHAEPNKASGHVMEKCGMHFVRYGEFCKLDGSCRMRSMIYEMTL